MYQGIILVIMLSMIVVMDTNWLESVVGHVVIMASGVGLMLIVSKIVTMEVVDMVIMAAMIINSIMNNNHFGCTYSHK
jgi:hypothetical protein